METLFRLIVENSNNHRRQFLKQNHPIHKSRAKPKKKNSPDDSSEYNGDETVEKIEKNQ